MPQATATDTQRKISERMMAKAAGDGDRNHSTLHLDARTIHSAARAEIWMTMK